MSWLGDMERNDPAYPGRPGDITTTSWSRSDVEDLEARLEAEESAEARADDRHRRYRGSHRRN